MIAAVGGVVVVGVVVGIVASQSGGASQNAYVSPGKRTAAPPLHGTSVSGDPVDITTSKGNVTVVNFWASWCGPCRAESDGLRQVALRSNDVAFVGVDEDHTNKAAAKSFSTQHKLPYPSVWDDTSDIAGAWNVPGLPQTFVVDPAGKVAARFSGAVTEHELTDVLNRVKAEKA